jgi:hypothetical protein
MEEERMMNKTMNDLSFNHAKLDHEALIRTAEIAFGELIESIASHASKLRNYSANYQRASLRSEWLAGDARKLVIVAETLDTLYGCRFRDEIEIINVIKEKDDESNNHQTEPGYDL